MITSRLCKRHSFINMDIYARLCMLLVCILIPIGCIDTGVVQIDPVYNNTVIFSCAVLKIHKEGCCDHKTWDQTSVIRFLLFCRNIVAMEDAGLSTVSSFPTDRDQERSSTSWPTLFPPWTEKTHPDSAFSAGSASPAASMQPHRSWRR